MGGNWLDFRRFEEHNAVDRGRFGRIYMANCTVRWTRPQDYYDQAPWRGTWEFDGGAFMNQASHYVDLIQWIVGPVDHRRERHRKTANTVAL